MITKHYLLKISGSIRANKHKEFEQTVRFVFNLIPSSCLSSHLALDVFNANMYHLFTLWRSESDLGAFKRSNEYQLLRGSVQTLGYSEDPDKGELVDVQAFEVDFDGDD
jgi:hypothetical protein